MLSNSTAGPRKVRFTSVHDHFEGDFMKTEQKEEDFANGLLTTSGVDNTDLRTSLQSCEGSLPIGEPDHQRRRSFSYQRSRSFSDQRNQSFSRDVPVKALIPTCSNSFSAIQHQRYGMATKEPNNISSYEKTDLKNGGFPTKTWLMEDEFPKGGSVNSAVDNLVVHKSLKSSPALLPLGEHRHQYRSVAQDFPAKAPALTYSKSFSAIQNKKNGTIAKAPGSFSGNLHAFAEHRSNKACAPEVMGAEAKWSIVKGMKSGLSESGAGLDNRPRGAKDAVPIYGSTGSTASQPILESLAALVTAHPGCFRKILSDSGQPCIRKQAACHSIVLSAELGMGSKLVDTGVMLQLIQQLKCADGVCRGQALAAIIALIQKTPLPSNSKLMHRSNSKLKRRLLSLCCACSTKKSSHKGSPSAATQFMVDAKGTKVLLQMLKCDSESISNIVLLLQLVELLAKQQGATPNFPCKDILTTVLHVLGNRCVPELKVCDDFSAVHAALGALDALLSQPKTAAADMDVEPVLQLLTANDARAVVLCAGVLKRFAALSDNHKMTIAGRGLGIAWKRLMLSEDSGLAILELMQTLAAYQPAKVYFDQEGLIPAFVDFMDGAWDFETIAAAGHVVAKLADGDQLCQSGFLKAEAVPVLKSLLQSGSSECQRAAADALLALVRGNRAGLQVAQSLIKSSEVMSEISQADDPVLKKQLAALACLLH